MATDILFHASHRRNRSGLAHSRSDPSASSRLRQEPTGIGNLVVPGDRVTLVYDAGVKRDRLGLSSATTGGASSCASASFRAAAVVDAIGHAFPGA